MLKNYNKKITFANHNYCRGDFYENNDKKDKKNKKSKSKFNDYTSFLNPEIVASDPQGMYTGVPADMYYNGELEKPIQDADDL